MINERSLSDEMTFKQAFLLMKYKLKFRNILTMKMGQKLSETFRHSMLT